MFIICRLWISKTRLDQPSSFTANFDGPFLGPPSVFFKLTSTGGPSVRIEELLDIPVSWVPRLHMEHLKAVGS